MKFQSVFNRQNSTSISNNSSPCSIVHLKKINDQDTSNVGVQYTQLVLHTSSVDTASASQTLSVLKKIR